VVMTTPDASLRCSGESEAGQTGSARIQDGARRSDDPSTCHALATELML
jgi:hypothetical protein